MKDMKKALNPFAKSIGLPKIDLKMKLSLFCLLITMLSLQANTAYSQKTKISLNMDNVTVAQVIDEIEAKTEFKFIFNTRVLDLKRLVSINVKKLTVDKVLNKLFDETKTTFEIDNRKILLRQKAVNKDSPVGDSKIDTPQNLQVNGTVTDENDAPLPGANILEKGTTNGVQTDFDGNFSITTSNENAILVVSYIGFKTQEIEIAGKTELKIELAEDAAGLDEVIVVGYGTQAKKDITGSISRVTSESLAERPIVSAESALQGLSPGLNVAQRNSRPGELGSVTIRAVGSISAGSDPLWVVDGFPTDQRNAAALNPADIASIDILKDASATSIYGSRGANGVIIITTKSARSGQSTLNFGVTSGVSTIARSSLPDILNAEEYVQYYTERNGGVTPESITNAWDGVTNTDWRDELYTTGIFQTYTLSASGGTEKISYLMSGGYFDQEGVIPGEGSKKYTARLKVDYRPSDKVTIGLNIAPNLTVNDSSSPNPQSPGNSFANVVGNPFGTNNSVIDFAELMAPILPVRRADGSFSQGSDIAGTNLANPLEVLENYGRTESLFRLLAGINFEYRPINGLALKTTLSTNIGSDEVETFYNAPTDGVRGNLPAESQLAVGQISNIGWLNENTVNYKKRFGENHSLDLLGGFTLQKDKSTSISSSIAGLPVEGVKVLSLGNSATLVSANTLTENTLVSYLGRANYSYKDRYLFTGTLRSDGSSRFGANNRFKTFSSFALGWRVSEENFLSKIESINDFKIRFSYGTTGSNSIPDFVSRASLTPGQTSFGGVPVTSVGIGDPGNPDLTWESATQLDFGVDLMLFNNRINFVFDYYNNETDGLLLSRSIEQSSGFAGFLTNIGSLRNRGIELTLNTRIIDRENFGWSLGGNVTNNDQEILDLGGVDEILNFFGAARQFVGGELQNIHALEVDGVDTDGNLIYVDVDGDGSISGFNGADGQNLEGVNLDWVYGFNTSVRYKNFELSALFNGQAGASVLDRQLFVGRFSGSNNVYSDLLFNGRYISENQPGNGVVPGAGETPQTVSTFNVQDTDYLRFRNLTLGYNIPENLLQKLGAKSGKVFFSVENVHTWTDYIGGNPDGRTLQGAGSSLTGGGSTLSGVGDARELAVNGSAHLPLPRTWTFGINVSL